jgi:hypothetical protein
VKYYTLPVKSTYFGLFSTPLCYEARGRNPLSDVSASSRRASSAARFACGAMSCLSGIAILNSIDQKRPIRIADLVKV